MASLEYKEMRVDIISLVCGVVSAITDAITLVMYVYAFTLYLQKINSIEKNLERIASQSDNALHVSSRRRDDINHSSSSYSDEVEIGII